MPGSTAIQLEGVSKRYRIYQQRHQTLKEAVLKLGRGRWEDLWALREITATIPRGQSVGVIGENGSGKSTLLKLLAGILEPDGGRLQVTGRVSALLELGASFQPEFTGAENIFLYGTMLGLRRRELKRRFDEIVEFAELGDFVDNPVKNYSSGTYMRLAFSVAVQVDPDVLLVDEVLAVGDEAFQQKCFARMAQFRGGERTVILVSHDLDAVRRFCDRVIWIDRGHLAADGMPAEVTRRYLDTTSERIASGDFGHAALSRHDVPEIGTATGQVQLGSVRILDTASSPRNVFRSGDTIQIEVRYRSHIASETASLAISIFRSDGLHCTEFDTAVDGLPFKLQDGTGTVVAEIPSFPFREGTYELSVGIFDSLTKTAHDYRHRRDRFQVQGTGAPGWLAEVEHRWQIHPGVSASRPIIVR